MYSRLELSRPRARAQIIHTSSKPASKIFFENQPSVNNSLSQNRRHWSRGFLQTKGSNGDLALTKLLGLLHASVHLVEPGLLERLAQGGVDRPVVLARDSRLLSVLLGRDRGRVTGTREEFKSETERFGKRPDWRSISRLFNFSIDLCCSVESE